MSDPRFRPKDWAENPEHFGRDDLEWMPIEPLVEAMRRREAEPQDIHAQMAQRTASIIQHDFVRRLRRRLREKGISLKQFAALSGSSYKRLLQVLTGDAILRIEDIADAERILDGATEFGITRRPDRPTQQPRGR